MGKRIIAILKGVARTMDLSPSDPPPAVQKDRTERMKRPWERTGQALRNSIDRYHRETSSR